MSDVSKTNEELLAKVMDTLAYYQCRASNPKADHPVQGYHAFSEEQRDHLREKQREGAEEIVRMFAATRVPVQGEPNDDRGTLMEAMKRGEKVRQAAWSAYGQEPDGEGTKPHSDNWYRAEALMAAGFSRAAVPDAATEGNYHEGLEEGIKIGRAERDAALAAVERVRAMHRRLNIVDEVTDERLGDACEVCCEIESYELTWPCPTVAALDGAPEPEWEYGWNWASNPDKEPTAYDAKSEMGRVGERAAIEEIAPVEEFRRAPGTWAGPWLPAEEESSDE